jgi:hypothetical protein
MARIGFICVEKVTTIEENGKIKRFDGGYDVDWDKVGSHFMFARI